MTERDEDHRARLFAELKRTGAEPVRNEIVVSFAPLAGFFAKRYQNRGVEAEDLRQIAQLALVKAVDRFDPDVGVQFSTFAGRTIDGELKRYFRDRAWAVRVPRGLQERTALVRQVRERLSADLNRAPTVAEIAREADLEEDDVLEALDAQQGYQASSLDAPVSDAEDAAPDARKLGASDPNFALTEHQMAVRALLDDLPERERTIVELRFFEDLSQTEIADRVGMSQMHVSRLLRRSLADLRDALDRD